MQARQLPSARYHAGAAIAVGAIAGFGRIAKVRDVDAFALGDLPDGLAFMRMHLTSVEREVDTVFAVKVFWIFGHIVTSL
jgi:hypothetical protein